MKTAIAALWEQIEASYGKEARDFLKGFYDERNRAYQQNLRNEEKKRQEEARAFYTSSQPEEEPALEDNPFQLSNSFRLAVLGNEDDAAQFDIEANRDSYE